MYGLETFVTMGFQSIISLDNQTTSSNVGISTTLVSLECDTDESTECYTPYAERPETYIVPVLFAIIFVVGVLGNGTLVIIFLRHRAMRNVPNT